jgi:hypothetical protein
MNKRNYEKIAAEIMKLKNLGKENDMTCGRNYASTVPPIFQQSIIKNTCLFVCLTVCN